MLLPRAIPCLLLRGAGLVKTTGFSKPVYVGDPVNAVRIFNEKQVDELVFLDISATPEGRGPDFGLIEEIAGEAFMPLAYGGGVKTLEEIGALFRIGVEKIILNTAAVENPKLVRDAAARFGSQSVVAAIDVKRTLFGRPRARIRGGKKDAGFAPEELARRMEELGAGEILVNDVDRDGTMRGYDLELVARVSGAVSVPVIACGGAGSLEDLRAGVRQGGAGAAAAGSMFVFHGRRRAVLITYPEREDLEALFAEKGGGA